MRHPSTKYGLFEELVKKSLLPGIDLNTIALKFLIPSGLKSAKKKVNETDSAGKKHSVSEELLFFYETDPNRLSKIRNEHYQQSGGRIKLNNEILKHYEDANAPKRCAKSFKKICCQSLPDLLDFVEKLYELISSFGLSPTGQEYLDHLYNQKRTGKQQAGEEKLLFISECFIYCVLEEEPKRWAKLLDYAKKQETATATNLRKYEYINFPYKRNKYFVERKSNSITDLKKLVLDEGVIALYGVTGSGKTQIALELGYNLSENGTVIWIDSSDKSKLSSSIKTALQAM